MKAILKIGLFENLKGLFREPVSSFIRQMLPPRLVATNI